MTLKQSQEHQTYNEIVEPKHDYNFAKYERSRFNNIWEKGNVEGCCFFILGNISIISLEHVRKSKTVIYSLSTWHNKKSYKVST